MNGLGLPKRTGMAQAISDFTTTKSVRIDTLSGTGSDYTVQTVPCIRFWVSIHASKETRIDILTCCLIASWSRHPSRDKVPVNLK